MVKYVSQVRVSMHDIFWHLLLVVLNAIAMAEVLEKLVYISFQ